MLDNIITTIDNWASINSDKLVYKYLEEKFTYGKLKYFSDSIADYLDFLNIRDKAPVIVYGGHKFEMLASFLGAVKSGHAYIPIDTHSPNSRISMIKEIANPGAIIATEQLPVEVNDIPVINPEKLSELSNKIVDYSLSHPVDGDDNFYIIFTSGTTGKPKGVQISHDNVVNYINWMISDAFKLPLNISATAQASFSFDVSGMGWITTLVKGGHLTALPREITNDFKKLFTMLPQLDVNTFISTPSFAEICLLEPSFNEKNMPNLNIFLFCGEELTISTTKKLFDRFPNAHIYNTYGPTEATVAVTAVEITKDLLKKGRLPIGYANPAVNIKIFDEKGNELGTGESGEIIITGKTVSKGYMNNPEKTKKAFFMIDEIPAYHTGDLGFIDSDGLVHYLGRMDFQIKLHGYRIELEEINHYLNNNKHIKQGVAVPKYDKDHKVAKLYAYVVPENNDFENELQLTTTIKKELKDSMMEYMIPNKFIYKDKLPLTTNGKVNIKSLIAEVNPE